MKGHGHCSPASEAARVYEREPCVRTFRQDLDLHLINGFVVSTPDIFIMGRPVRLAFNGDRTVLNAAVILNPAFPFDREECNCWHIYLMAGDKSKCWAFYPFPLRYVSWERRNRIRFHEMATIQSRIEQRS